MACIGRRRVLRWGALVTGGLNLAVVVAGVVLSAAVLRAHRCRAGNVAPVVATAAVAALRIGAMVGTAVAQWGFASVAACRSIGGGLVNGEYELRRRRAERRKRYKQWVWWSRSGSMILAIQILVAVFLTNILVKSVSHEGDPNECFFGKKEESRGWKGALVVSFLVVVWLVVIIQCLAGPKVLRWRAFYSNHDTAWKAHYLDVFDHGIRELFCCLGRGHYLNTLEEDDVYSVAGLLSELLAYHAKGTGHLELLAGLSQLQRNKNSPTLGGDLIEVPEACIREAASWHQFAEAAYTGKLLDVGRNHVMFLCTWFYRQGVLTPWTRSRRPQLDGDNWWRGHAAAFLKHCNLPPKALQKGRVVQIKREAAYFIVVLHDRKSVVISIRGTETFEDIITDGLFTCCTLTMDDLDGLINCNHLPALTRQHVLSSFPHYGHSGVVESARELFKQIDGDPEDKDDSIPRPSGFLSSLLGVGRECHGYKVRIIGHSLGGAIAALLGLRLYGRYPDLHVYCYGPLPCLDSIVAEACTDFVTSIVINDEYTARLSAKSIDRLRAAAIAALSDDPSAEPRNTGKLACRTSIANRLKHSIEGGLFLCGHAVCCVIHMPSHKSCSHRIGDGSLTPCSTPDIRHLNGKMAMSAEMSNQHHQGHHQDDSSIGNSDSGIQEEAVSRHSNPDIPTSGCHECADSCKGTCFATFQTTDGAPSSIGMLTEDSTELYLPGLIIHIVQEQRKISPLWKRRRLHDREGSYKAFLAHRESFKDITVSPDMFLDHLPWRCRYAMQRVIEAKKPQF